ncbi:sodium- and chloride-dependent neutral and basic amino acid transporter B(0+)-like [Heterodontus francisci]|uniref:sodium- and chloride-dependent neutral and basic amino acid transporter B(0+)-like n=1 Tax=Heterodontus francisci TaxID=7792 RepID=UPI00355B349E
MSLCNFVLPFAQFTVLSINVLSKLEYMAFHSFIEVIDKYNEKLRPQYRLLGGITTHILPNGGFSLSNETVLTTLLDQFPKVLRSKRIYLTTGVCLLCYFLGLVCVTQAGIYWINLVDHFCVGWGLIITALLELISLSWIYGINRFIKDIEMMIGERNWLFWLWWRVCWFFISPCVLTAVLFWTLTTFTPPSYGPIEYPVWGTALGWCMVIFCILWIPIVAIVRVFRSEGSTLCQKISAVCTSAPDWGPYLEQHRGERYRNRPDSTESPNRVQLLAISKV